MVRLVAVGDVHGCSQTLTALLERIALEPGDTLLTIGDLSAKGIDSCGVHQQLIELQRRGVELIPLVGNHELMLLAMQRFLGVELDLPQIPDAMLQHGEVEFFIRANGAWATLKSYGFDRIDERLLWAFGADHPRRHFENVAHQIRQQDWVLPQSHLDLLAQCKTHHLARNCLFVHAGIHPDFLTHSRAAEAVRAQLNAGGRDLCWNREWLGMTPNFPELIVHGHTPLSCLFSRLEDTGPWKDDSLVFKSVIHAGALNLDSGVFLDAGHLTAVEVPEDGDWQSLRFIRVPRLDPVEKDNLWYVNLTS